MLTFLVKYKIKTVDHKAFIASTALYATIDAIITLVRRQSTTFAMAYY